MLNSALATLRILAIDTASEVSGVGIADASELIALEELPLSAARSRNLAPLIVSVLARAEMALAEVEVIAVAAGPGSFNGVRVGLATAYGLSAALTTGIVSVSTLAAMAWSVNPDSRPRLAILDARRGEVFVARFEVEGEMVRRVTDDTLMDPAAAMTMAVAGDLVLASGRGARELSGLGTECPVFFSTSVVVGLVRYVAASGRACIRGALPPIATYLRSPR